MKRAAALPISAESGRYEYFLFQYLRTKMNIGVFVLQTPDPTTGPPARLRAQSSTFQLPLSLCLKHSQAN